MDNVIGFLVKQGRYATIARHQKAAALLKRIMSLTCFLLLQKLNSRV